MLRRYIRDGELFRDNAAQIARLQVDSVPLFSYTLSRHEGRVLPHE